MTRSRTPLGIFSQVLRADFPFSCTHRRKIAMSKAISTLSTLQYLDDEEGTSHSKFCNHLLVRFSGNDQHSSPPRLVANIISMHLGCTFRNPSAPKKAFRYCYPAGMLYRQVPSYDQLKLVVLQNCFVFPFKILLTCESC